MTIFEKSVEMPNISTVVTKATVAIVFFFSALTCDGLVQNLCSNSLLTPNIKEQILLSCPHTFLIKSPQTYCGEVIKMSRNSNLGGHVLNSHDLRG